MPDAIERRVELRERGNGRDQQNDKSDPAASLRFVAHDLQHAFNLIGQIGRDLLLDRSEQALLSFLSALTAEKLGNASASPTDAQKAEATRAAWVQAALVLLNSNEFLYVH